MECLSVRTNRLIAPIIVAVFAVLTLGQAAHADLLIAVDKSTQRRPSRSTASKCTTGR